jgi:hypothetical protein
MCGQRIDRLKDAVRLYREQSPHVRLVAFDTGFRTIGDVSEIGLPAGGTNLHLALDYAASVSAGKVVVFTDGEPTDEAACFEAASRIPGVVNAIFCGDGGDDGGRRFCDRLARDNGGQSVAKDIAKGQAMICDEVADLLGLPAPIALQSGTSRS